MTYAIIQYVGTNYLCYTHIDLWNTSITYLQNRRQFVGGSPNVLMGTLIRDKITTEWRRKFDETKSLFAHGNLISTKLYSSRRKFTDS